MQLSSLDACKDVTSLTSVQSEPTDPAAKQALASLREGVAALKANVDSGRFRVARDQAEPLVARARNLGYAPLLAEILLMWAAAKQETGADSEARVEALRAAAEAERGRADATMAKAFLWLTRSAFNERRIDEAERWSELTEAALERAGNVAATRAEWLGVSGLILSSGGRQQASVDRIHEAVALARDCGLDAITLVRIERYLGWPLLKIGRIHELKAVYDEAERELVAAVGSDHPSRIQLLHAASSAMQSDANLALEYAVRAEDLIQRVAPDSRDLPRALTNKCDAERRLHLYDAAAADCARALEAATRLFSAESYWVASVEITTGEVLLERGQLSEAGPHFERALNDLDRETVHADDAMFELLTNMGTLRLRQHRMREAIALLERALTLLPSAFPDGSTDTYAESITAQLRQSLAEALWESGDRSHRPEQLAREAAEAYRHAGDQAAAAAVERWVSSRAARR
jgi:tetratricopeptide (TPR) repeat protein